MVENSAAAIQPMLTATGSARRQVYAATSATMIFVSNTQTKVRNIQIKPECGQIVIAGIVLRNNQTNITTTKPTTSKHATAAIS
jgi:hypothetical protein